MQIAYYVVITLHVLTCLFLIGVVLLQQGKSQDLASAFGGGGTQTAFGPRGSANVLSKATTILAGLFMVTSLSLTVLRPSSGTILQQLPADAPSPAASAPTTPVAPAAPTSAAPTAPTSAAPAAPTGDAAAPAPAPATTTAPAPAAPASPAAR